MAASRTVVNATVANGTRRREGAADARVVRARHAASRLRAGYLAYARCERTGYCRVPGHAVDPVLPAAQRADRQPGSAEVRSGSRQAPARAAGATPAHAIT